ncbi:MAG: polymorphic toxin type 23 domain-containing protein [Bacteroidota bacterium]
MNAQQLVTLLFVILLSLSALGQERKKRFVEMSIGARYTFHFGVLRNGYLGRFGFHLGQMVALDRDNNIIVPIGFGFDLYQNGLGAQNIDNRSLKQVHHDIHLSVGIQAGSATDRPVKQLLSTSYAFARSSRIPHVWGGGIGTRWIWMDPLKPGKKTQRIGYLNLQMDHFQLHYANDGAIPFNFSRLGDNYDRFWTGSGMLSYEDEDYRMLVGFDRFTGYRTNAFEFATLMGYKRVYYDEEQTFYNRGEWNMEFVAKRFRTDFGISLKFADMPFIETQDFIHYTGRMAIHPTPNKPNIFIGGVVDYNHNEDF